MTQQAGEDRRPRFPKGLPRLPKTALSVWAKSNMRDPTDPSHLQVWQHLEDTGAIAGYVWDRFTPKHVRDLIATDADGEKTARTVYRFLASVHDVGKCSPAFQCMIPSLADRTRAAGLHIREGLKDSEDRGRYRHELVGAYALEDWMRLRGCPAGENTAAHGLATAIAAHHGRGLDPEKAALMRRPQAINYTGDEAWADARTEMLDHMAHITGFDRIMRELKPIRRRSLILLTGLVVVADWMASNNWLFPLSRGEADEHGHNPERRAARAWKRMNLPGPWTPPETSIDPERLFETRFGIAGASIRPVQREAVLQADRMQEPGLMIIEAATGEGKTEAALMAAERLAVRFDCGGVFYGLPTMATATAMFHRVDRWVSSMPANGRPSTSLFLAHSRNTLDDTFANLPDSVELAEDSGDDTLVPTLSSWMGDTRRGLLSNFVVGTVDQMLMAGLNAKYAVLRHLALAGKVVILDEVHASTAWMDVYMETVLAWLGQYGVPVIMLSATLPEAKRLAYETAYRGGAQTDKAVTVEPAIPDWTARRRARRIVDGSQGKTEPIERERSMGYPLVTVAQAVGVTTMEPASSGRRIEVDMRPLDDTDDSLVELLRGSLSYGGCAIVIRDTVNRAVRTAHMLREKTDLPVMLAHSRFTAVDRMSLDRTLVDRFGPGSTSEARRGVVVSTQVAEQSLDVDFDLMVSDIAPIDLLIQRAGRLHRHVRPRPEGLERARLYVTGMEAINPDRTPEFSKGVERVYPRLMLMRAASAMGLEHDGMTMTIPTDVPGLIHAVYGGDDICPDTWREGPDGERMARQQLDERISGDRTKAAANRIGRPDDTYADGWSMDDWMAHAAPDPESPKGHASAAGVRGGVDSIGVLLLETRDGRICLPERSRFMDVPPIPDGMESTLDQDTLRAVLACEISLPPAAAPGYDTDRFIATLERAAPERWHEIMHDNHA